MTETLPTIIHQDVTSSTSSEGSFGDSFVRYYDVPSPQHSLVSSSDFYPIIPFPSNLPGLQNNRSLSPLRFARILSKLQQSPLFAPFNSLLKHQLSENNNSLTLTPDSLLELVSHFAEKLRAIDPSKSFHRWIDNIGRFHEEFEVIERIGKGAYGICFKCKHLIDDRILAVKKTRFELGDVSKIFREVQMLARCHHPNIVNYLSSWCELELSSTAETNPVDTPSESFKNGSTSSLQSTNPSSIDLSPTDSSSTSTSASQDCSSSIVELSEESLEFSEASSIHLDTMTFPQQSDPQSQHTQQPQPQQQSLAVPVRLSCQLYISTEFCAGGSLRRYFDQRNGQLDVPRCMKILLDILQGLAYIHSQHIIHRDLKPGNILLAADGTAKLCDFGLAKLIIPSSGQLVPLSIDPALSSPSTFSFGSSHHTSDIGTRFYVAPELLTSSKSSLDGLSYGTEVDIFSMGILSIELFFPTTSHFERALLFEQIRTQQVPVSLQQQFPDLTVWFEKMISHLPSERPDASQLLRKLFPELDYVQQLQGELDNAQKTIEQLTSELSRLRSSVVLD